MVRPSWCVCVRQGLRAKCKIKSSYCFMTTNGKVEEWLFVLLLLLLLYSVFCQTSVVLRIKQSAALYWPTAASHFCLSSLGSTVVITITISVFLKNSFSVEALAPALAPVAVDHQANDDEKDTAQHGEEHGEENSNSTHPFFSLTHWKRGRQSES